MIPGNFLGFSFEVSDLGDNGWTDPHYAAAATLLGPGVARFGGNSVDVSTWSPNPATGNDSDLTGIDFDHAFTFAHNAGWTVYLGINLGQFAPDTFAAEAAYAAGRPGASGVLTAIEIGNEPDVFTGSYRGPGYDGDSIASEYAGYSAALAQRASGIPRVGPAMCCRPQIFAEFLAAGGSKGLHLLTYHHYPTIAIDTAAASPTNSSIGNLLSATTMAGSVELIDIVVADAKTVGLPLRMGESNSTSGGGRLGTSDAFASALWGLDYLYTLAEHGVIGVNLHGSPAPNGGIYSPLVDSAGVRAKPLFYAMLAFHAGAGGAVLPVKVTAPTNVAAHATLASDGTLRVTVVNKDTVNAVFARVTPAAAYRAATVQFMTASSVHAKTGVTFAGAAVSGTGTWTPQAPFAISGANGTFGVPLSAASAAVVTLVH